MDKQALDKYLTAGPNNAFGDYAESVCNKLSPSAIAYDEKTSWTYTLPFEEFLLTLFRENVSVDLAAKIVNSAHANLVEKY